MLQEKIMPTTSMKSLHGGCDTEESPFWDIVLVRLVSGALTTWV